MRDKRVVFAKILLISVLGGGILTTNLLAKEQTNWIFGVGIGVGLNQLDQKWGDSTRNGIGVGGWNQNKPDATMKDWGVTYEILAGYKHWLNDWIGFRYYGNIGIQHYKADFTSAGNNAMLTKGKNKTSIEYTANADMLLNFYNSEIFTFGILGGFGIGGAYLNSPSLDNYEWYWGAANDSIHFTESEYAGMGKVKRHHLSASLSVGARFNIFQKIRDIGARTCNTGADGRRTCRVPISYLEHSIEINAKFNMLTYYPTKYGELIGVRQNNGQGVYNNSSPRPGYEIKNPYKITLRYIIAF